MPDTDPIHELVRSEPDFEALIAKVNDEARFYELFTSVEGVGRETDMILDVETIHEIDHYMLGWMALLWEAHQSEPAHKDAKLDDLRREPSMKDVFFSREVG